MPDIECDKACELWGTGVAGAGWEGSPPIYTWHSTHTLTHTRMHCTDGSESHPRHRNTHKHSSARVLVASGLVTRSFLFSQKRKLSSLKLQDERAGVSSPRTGRPGGGGCARGVTRPLCPEPLSFDGRSRLSILLTLLLLLTAHLLSIQTRACSEDNRGEQADSYKMLPSRRG